MSRKDLSPENLIADFGPESQLAAEVVGVLAKLVDSGKHPKANVIYEEWRPHFWHRLRDRTTAPAKLRENGRADESVPA